MSRDVPRLVQDLNNRTLMKLLRKAGKFHKLTGSRPVSSHCFETRMFCGKASDRGCLKRRKVQKVSNLFLPCFASFLLDIVGFAFCFLLWLCRKKDQKWMSRLGKSCLLDLFPEPSLCWQTQIRAQVTQRKPLSRKNFHIT